MGDEEQVEDLDVPASEAEDVKGGSADIFAKLGDIKGESVDSKHKDQIEVLSYRRP
jgi:type VI protein secretion system component Hcp